MKTDMISCKVDKQTKALIKEKAKELDISQARIIEQAIRKGLEEKEYGIEPIGIVGLRSKINDLGFKAQAGMKLQLSDFEELEKEVAALWQ